MSAELVHANVNDLDRLDPQSREVAVTSMLSEARQWLAHAVEATEPKRISEFKAFMATVAETTKQLNLSKDIQLDALEMVRRAERGVGKAIRDGQERGEINGHGSHDMRGNRHISRKGGDHVASRKAPTEFASKSELTGGNKLSSPGIYALADDVSDEQFEEALDEAKSEKNVSRANVVRKLRKDNVTSKEWQKVQALADEGWTSAQIHKKLELYSDADSFRRNAKAQGITFSADKAVGRARRIDPNRVMRETVNAVASHVDSFDLVDYDALDPDEAHEWVDSLTQSIKALSKARNQIKESLR